MQKLKCVEGRAHIFSELQSNNSVSFVKSAGGVGMFMEKKLQNLMHILVYFVIAVTF